MAMNRTTSRRHFLLTASLLSAGAAWTGCATQGPSGEAEAVIDIHQHAGYSGRTEEQLLAHQRMMGVSLTLLLPAGRDVERPSTDMGRSNGLAAKCLGNEVCASIAARYRREYRTYSNEVPDLPEARREIEKYLRRGAVGIGEQKFHLDCDSPPIELVAEIALEWRVPVLLHFQHEAYNTRLERFHRILEKYPKVPFIGHAQTLWANLDADADPKVLYPKGRVRPGGLTDRLLSEYPNMYADLSAGSGLNGLTRDEEFTRGFLHRHQDKLLFGSDCNDVEGRGEKCQGARILEAVRRLAPSRAVERKVLYHNARKLFRLG
jgi:predicted TIM-barrel fold metal-dependent hydrolase